jgi:hypothetical protein
MKLLLSVFAAIAAIALAPHNAQASSYSTSNGKTLIEFKELPDNAFTGPVIGGAIGEGRYTTTIGTQQWIGSFTTTPGAASGGIKSYVGTFTDRRIGPGATEICKGTIKLQRPASNIGPAPLQVTWTIGPGGVSCPPVTPSTLSLTEAIPMANGSGNFLASNSNTRPSETNGPITWPLWQVIDSPQLNCRATAPSGQIAEKFLTGSVITAGAKFNPNAFVTVGGASWLSVRVSQGNYCFVRANTSYIKPKLMPF